MATESIANIANRSPKSNIIPFPTHARILKSDPALEHLLSGVREVIERRGGIWDAEAHIPRIQRLKELLAFAVPAVQC